MKTKTTKRIEAEERQLAHDLLSDNEKLAKLDKSGFTASKERTKLTTLIKGVTSKKANGEKVNDKKSSKAITKKEAKAIKKKTKKNS